MSYRKQNTSTAKKAAGRTSNAKAASKEDKAELARQIESYIDHKLDEIVAKEVQDHRKDIFDELSQVRLQSQKQIQAFGRGEWHESMAEMYNVYGVPATGYAGPQYHGYAGHGYGRDGRYASPNARGYGDVYGRHPGFAGQYAPPEHYLTPSAYAHEVSRAVGKPKRLANSPDRSFRKERKRVDMISIQDTKYGLQGFVKPGFEAAFDLFKINFEKGYDRNSQLAVWVDQECVIDVYGSNTDQFDGDSRPVIFSSGKSVASILMAFMVDQGRLKYSEKVCTYWPEFAKNGKENITVADVLRHECGMHKLDQLVKVSDAYTENILNNSIGKIIEDDQAAYVNGVEGGRMYHAISRDWITNEIFRRVEPQGRTFDQFMRQEVNPKLESTGISIASTEGELQKFVKMDQFYAHDFSQANIDNHGTDFCMPNITKANQAKLNATKTEWNAKIDTSFKSQVPENPLKQLSINPLICFEYETKLTAKDEIQTCSLQEQYMEDVLFSKECMKGETASCQCTASARGLAKLAAFMANQGELNGQTLFSKETWSQLHGEEKIALDYGYFGRKLYTNMTQGGLGHFGWEQYKNGILKDGEDTEEKPTELNNCLREGYFGWKGLGGSVFQWHPELKIGFAYVPVDLNTNEFPGIRGGRIQQKVAEIVKEINGQKQ